MGEFKGISKYNGLIWLGTLIAVVIHSLGYLEKTREREMGEFKGISKYIGLIWLGALIAVVTHSLGYLEKTAGAVMTILQTYTSVA